MYHVHGTTPVQHVADRPDHSDEQPFLSENDAAMNKMMADMTIKPTGDVDRDFVAMMVPHHQGAVDMAKAELKYGHNEQLRRLAQEIVVTQQQEITVMRHAVGDEFPPAAAAPTQPGAMPSSASSDDARSHSLMNMK
jgi:ribosomal protein L16 Arg81 hydroxylase